MGVLPQPGKAETSESRDQNASSVNEPPPFLDSWSRVYAAVLCYLTLLIAALYFITRAFRY
jgi:hypothetical protein